MCSIFNLKNSISKLLCGAYKKNSTWKIQQAWKKHWASQTVPRPASSLGLPAAFQQGTVFIPCQTPRISMSTYALRFTPQMQCHRILFCFLGLQSKTALTFVLTNYYNLIRNIPQTQAACFSPPNIHHSHTFEPTSEDTMFVWIFIFFLI